MPVSPKPAASDYALARLKMVQSQLRPAGVTDARILAAMESLPRELFVPSTHVDVAYSDDNTKLISGRSMMQPMVLALLAQAAEIKDSDRVLELAPATGYSTLLLASMTSHIFSVEPDALLHREAEKNVAAYAPGNAQILAGAPVEGCIIHAPFDVIFINGSVEFVPQFLFDQLGENGRLVCVFRAHNEARSAHVGEARVYRKVQGRVTFKALFNAGVPPAPGFCEPVGFTL